MKRKIFISINIPNKAKKRLVSAVEKWQDLPVKWTKESNLHITLFFLGYIDDESAAEVCSKVREIAENEDIFDLNMEKIELAPSADDPQMIWLIGEPSEELRKIHEKVEKALGMFKAERKIFRPHITLGRLRKHKWESLKEKPGISEKFQLIVPVESIDVMASDFGDGQNEYSLIESCQLK
ncbi:MAG TPA: RNA 2',3'-cyclic phosphodiesterase [Candidatus Moranbacteria bacterium]|nr:RNA 2',3'-cyclic phosphodiesterase [Candidatus Moranbacteria bacterium]